MKIFKELLPYLIIIVVVVLIRSFVLTPVKVNGRSMAPTLEGKEVMLLNKIKKITRFDIVVIDIKDDRLIKRVIALPGETIEVIDNEIFINGKTLEDEYGSGITYDFEKVKLKNDEYFVMGDNREDSKDSRYYGPFSKEEIQGETNLIVYPFKSFGKVK